MGQSGGCSSTQQKASVAGAGALAGRGAGGGVRWEHGAESQPPERF